MKRKFLISVILCMVMSFALAFVACGPNDIAVTGVTLDKSSATLEVEETLQLTAAVEPADALDKTVLWDSSNDRIASVSMTGLVTAKGVGTATITVTTVDGDFTAECVITVTAADPDPDTPTDPDPDTPADPDPDTPVDPDPDTPADPDPDTPADPDPDTPVDPDPDTPVDPDPDTPVDPDPDTPVDPDPDTPVDPDPDTPVDPDPDTPADPEPEVIPVTNVTLNIGTITLKVGENVTLNATVFPADATNKDVTWNSTAKTIASVDNNGKITALEVGTTRIVVTTVDGSKKAECVVSVETNEVPVTGITISETELDLVIGETYDLDVTVLPEDATNKTVVWSSNNEAVATVDANGNVSALIAGTATITVTTVDGEFTATCTVTVSTISLSVSDITLKNVSSDHKTCQLEFTSDVSGADAITWTSLDSSIASVSNTGLVTGHKTGETKIKVDVRFGSKTTTVWCTVHVQFSNIEMPEMPF